MQAIAQFVVLFAGPIGLVLLTAVVVGRWLWRALRPETSRRAPRRPLQLVPDRRHVPQPAARRDD